MAAFLTAADIEKLPPAQVAFVPLGTRLTPLARDRAGERQIEIVELDAAHFAWTPANAADPESSNAEAANKGACGDVCTCGCRLQEAAPIESARDAAAQTAIVKESSSRSIFAGKIIRGPDANVFRNLL